MKKYEYAIIGVIIVFIIGIVFAINHVFKNDYQMYSSEGIYYDKATVISILEENIYPSTDLDGWYLGTQTLLVEFTSGIEKGEQVEVRNSLSSSRNIMIEEGSKIIIKADRPDEVAPYYTVYNYDRDSGLLAVIAIFILFMVLVGRIKGLKSVIGLCVSLFCIGAFLLPAIYRGWSPVGMTIITVLVVSTISLVLLNGFCEKTYVAIIATVLGVLVSALFFYIIESFLHVSGFNLGEADDLIIISRSTGLQIKQVFFAGVLISSLGAVIDTTMSIAAALYEIRELHPETSRQSLFQSGVVIGQDMIGTMCQTLILAFVGSAMATLLVMISYGTQINQFLCSDYMATEVVQAMSGSMAIILAVPITAFLCTVRHIPSKSKLEK